MRHHLALTVTILSLTISACTRSEPGLESKSLPKEWYALAKGTQALSKDDSSVYSASLPKPSASADRAVHDIFRAHSLALNSANVKAPLETFDNLPGDLTPWHLQGMIASFALSVNGVLGALLFQGTPSIKGTWERVDNNADGDPSKASRKADLHISPNTSPADISKQIEPSIRASIASGLISGDKAENTLRNNINRYAQNFLTLTRALSTTSFGSAWEVENFRLELNFDSSGNVTPVTTAGVNVNFRFDWEKGEGAPQSDSSGTTSDLQTNLQAFVASISDDIHQVTSEASAMENSPFVMDEVRIGLGISVSGDVGIATDAASMVGSITFSKSEAPPTLKAQSHLLRMKQAIQPDKLPVITTSSTHLPARPGIGPYSFLGGIVNSIKRSYFRAGLARSIEMGRYFAEAGARSEDSSASWRLSEIEAEFDMSVGGTLGVTTVDGLGVVVCTFSRKE